MPHTWKIKIKGNSMGGLFADGKELLIKVILQFSTVSDVEVGQVIILKKRIIPDHFFRPENPKHSLIIHRIVGKFWSQNCLYFWEKGDNDYFPKLCTTEEILGIVTKVEGYHELQANVRARLWRKRNKKLLQFYTIAGKMYFLIRGRNSEIGGNSVENKGMVPQKLIYRIWQKGFWALFYLICSALNLKGK